MAVRRSWILLLPALLAGCALAPGPLRGAFEGVTPEQVSGGLGDHVRWGGKIVDVAPQEHTTCFTVLSRPLNDTGRPNGGDKTLGRFIACAPGFYDPQVYTQNRLITVVGNIAGTTTKKIGDYPYRYPTVKVSKIYLWPVLAKGRQ